MYYISLFINFKYKNMKYDLIGLLFVFVSLLLVSGCSVTRCDYYSEDSRIKYSKVIEPGKNELTVDIQKYHLEVIVNNPLTNKIVKKNIFNNDIDLNNLFRYAISQNLLYEDFPVITSVNKNSYESLLIAYEGNTNFLKFTSPENYPRYLQEVKILISELLNYYYPGWEKELGPL